MTPERHALVKQVFLDVVEHTPAQWHEILKQRCDGDADLQTEVEQLLANHVEHGMVASEGGSRPAPAGLNPPADFRQDDADLFSSGTMIGQRYRIVSLLGRGGMGDVYRADDLVLGHTVALKFLKATFTRDPSWCARFQNEVRSALKITHPNVCRVYDIGEIDGDLFLSMEYVDGDDLKSLIRRIGRLSRDKAVDLARQICVGLAAAHQAGILHRDLKPANIMVDGRGAVRITDFGLASMPENVSQEEIAAGTPAYMAPEQILGKAVSQRSDIYSLGLVLYEIFCGRPAFDGNSVGEYQQLHESSRPQAISDQIDNADPDVERIILQCLEKNPSDRPESALAVAAALPGENILALAVAANMLPTPTMVAEGEPASVRLPGSVALASTVFVLLLSVLGFRAYQPFGWERALDKAPEVLAEGGSEIMDRFGASGDFAAYGYCSLDEIERLRHHEAENPESEYYVLGTDSPIVFWYRRSPQWLEPIRASTIMFGAGRVSLDDPPWTVSHISLVILDPDGRLLLFRRGGQSPANNDPENVPLEQGMLEFLSKSAGIEIEGDLTSLAVNAERQFDRPLTGGGRLQGFMDGEQIGGLAVVRSARAGEMLFSNPPSPETPFRLLVLAVSLCAIPLAFRNLRAGMSDIKGAARLAVFLFVLQSIIFLLRIQLAGSFDVQIDQLCLKVLLVLGASSLVAILYLALEPIARRYWPDMLITWSRLMATRIRDAVVARHVLIGVGIGCFWGLATACESHFASMLTGQEHATWFHSAVTANLLGGRMAWGGMLEAFVEAILRGLLFVLLLALLRAWLVRPRMAAVLAGLLIATIVVPRGTHLVSAILVLGIGGVGVAVWLMVRFGLLSLVTALFVTSLLLRFPLTIRLDHWSGDQSLAILVVVGVLLVYGFMASRTGSTNSADGHR